MYRPSITQIASLLLVASFAGAAAAQEARMIPSTSGTIRSIDPQSRIVVLESGSRFTVSENTDFTSLRSGSDIVVIGGEESSDRLVVNVQGRDVSATVVTNGGVPHTGTTMNSENSNRVVVTSSESFGESPGGGTVTLGPSSQASSNVVRTAAVGLINSAPPRTTADPSSNVVRKTAVALINSAPPRVTVNPNNNVVRKSAVALINAAPPRNISVNPTSSSVSAVSPARLSGSNSGMTAKPAIDGGTLAPSQPPGSNANALGPSEPPSRSTGALSPSGPLNGQPR